MDGRKRAISSPSFHVPERVLIGFKPHEATPPKSLEKRCCCGRHALALQPGPFLEIGVN